MRSKTPYLVFTLSAVYLSILSVHSFSWTFISSDSGGFLASIVTWMNPQPYGAPLYILLGHFLNLFGHIEFTMPIVLSAIPGAISVAFVYLIVTRLTGKHVIALISSAVLLGSAVFLAESSVLIYHSFAAMFVTLALWSFIQEKRILTMLFLGLGTAVHVMVIPITVLWILADIAYQWKEKRWKFWLCKPLFVFIVVGVVPYMMVLILMAIPSTPKFLAGNLNLDAIIGYWSSTSKTIVGSISVWEFPSRLTATSKIVFMSFGLALVPITVFLFRFFKDKMKSRVVIALIAINLYVFWYVLTCMDAQTWTYLVFASASLAILAGLGMDYIKSNWQQGLVALSAVSLIGSNVVFLNANVLTNRNPIGERYLTELDALPDGAIVLTEPGPYSMGMFYAINKGKNIVPLVYPYLDDSSYGRADYATYVNTRWGVDFTNTDEQTKRFVESLQKTYGTDKVNWVDVPEAVQNYHDWLKSRYGVTESGTMLAVENALKDGRPIYAATEWYSIVNRAFVREGTGLVKRITGLTGQEPAPYKKAAKGQNLGTDPFTNK